MNDPKTFPKGIKDFINSVPRTNTDDVSLRDHIACQALTGILSNHYTEFEDIDKEYLTTTSAHCYLLADAMLQERGGKDDR